MDEDIEKKKMSYQQKKNLPDSAFALVYTDSKGKKIRKFPLSDAAHVRNAIARFPQASFSNPAAKKTVARKILRAAKKYGIEVAKDSAVAQSARSASAKKILDVLSDIRKNISEYRELIK